MDRMAFTLPSLTPKPSGEDAGGEEQAALSFAGFLLVNPLKVLEEVLVSITTVIVLLALWKNRDKVLLLITGEDRIHATPLDLVWWTCFKCCGACSHEWTRALTSCCCCPQRVRGTNLVKSAGALVGVATHTVEISNIVVGDLPFFGRRGDFYLSIECANNPPIHTSVAEGKCPKVVHFPEVVTLRVRFSRLEKMVRITVYELNLIGSEQLCQVHLSAENVIRWSTEADGKPKRFAMKPHEQAVELETHPWIVLEFDSPRSDVRQLDRLSGRTSIRTATWAHTNTQTGQQGTYVETGMKSFKHQYRLLDSTGNRIQEPLEEDLGTLHCYRACVKCVYRLATTACVCAVLGYLALRTYIRSCWLQYRRLTMTLSLKPNITIPISEPMLQHVADSCADFVEGTGIGVGRHACRPSRRQVTAMCHSPPLGQPPAAAFTGVGAAFVGPHEGLPCFKGICKYHNELARWDKLICAACGLLLFCTCCLFKPCANLAIERKKRSLRQSHSRRGFGASP